jgi:hypothetical protein
MSRQERVLAGLMAMAAAIAVLSGPSPNRWEHALSRSHRAFAGFMAMAVAIAVLTGHSPGTAPRRVIAMSKLHRASPATWRWE